MTGVDGLNFSFKVSSMPAQLVNFSPSFFFSNTCPFSFSVSAILTLALVAILAAAFICDPVSEEITLGALVFREWVHSASSRLLLLNMIYNQLSTQSLWPKFDDTHKSKSSIS